MADPILSAEQTHAWLLDGHEDTLDADDRMYRSHEALRAALDVARLQRNVFEAERDSQQRVAIQMMEERDETNGRLKGARAANAPLKAEVVELRARIETADRILANIHCEIDLLGPMLAARAALAGEPAEVRGE